MLSHSRCFRLVCCLSLGVAFSLVGGFQSALAAPTEVVEVETDAQPISVEPIGIVAVRKQFKDFSVTGHPSLRVDVQRTRRQGNANPYETRITLIPNEPAERLAVGGLSQDSKKLALGVGRIENALRRQRDRAGRAKSSHNYAGPGSYYTFGCVDPNGTYASGHGCYLRYYDGPAGNGRGIETSWLEMNANSSGRWLRKVEINQQYNGSATLVDVEPTGTLTGGCRSQGFGLQGGSVGFSISLDICPDKVAGYFFNANHSRGTRWTGSATGGNPRSSTMGVARNGPAGSVSGFQWSTAFAACPVLVSC